MSALTPELRRDLQAYVDYYEKALHIEKDDDSDGRWPMSLVTAIKAALADLDSCKGSE